MPVRIPPVTENASQVLLEQIVDYAGLFPPAKQSMAAAVRNYAHYRASGNGWMLGRFVCPATALDEFSAVADPFLPRDAGAIPWRLAIVGSGNAQEDASAIAMFNERHRVCFDECGAIADCYEARVASPADVEALGAQFNPEMSLYIEVPLGQQPSPFIEAIRRANRRAKMRTGGVTADAFPAAERVVRFLACCIENGVAAKATAGLHHALCGEYPLTYEQGSSSARMYGFVNVFLAAALLAAGASTQDALMLLREGDRASIDVNDLQVGWRGPEQVHVLDRTLLSQVRQRVLVSFGSCSFTEPVNEARELGLL